LSSRADRAAHAGARLVDFGAGTAIAFLIPVAIRRNPLQAYEPQHIDQGVTMNYRNTLIAAAVAALVPLAGTALANDNDKDKMAKSGASFDALDTNRDGRISRAEASADAKISFAQADTNGDGYLDNMEYSNARSSMKSGDENSGDTTSPQPQSQSSPYPNDASGQQTEPVTPTDPSSTEPTTPPTDTETPRQ
jgi:hypothetical protein